MVGLGRFGIFWDGCRCVLLLSVISGWFWAVVVSFCWFGVAEAGFGYFCVVMPVFG